LSAPYGIYQTKDSYLALAMGNLSFIAEILEVDLSAYPQKAQWFSHKDEITRLLAGRLKQNNTVHWLQLLNDKGIWCSPIYNYQEFLNHEAYKVLGFDQELDLPDGEILKGTRSPIRINGERLYSRKAAPKAGSETELINQQFNLI